MRSLLTLASIIAHITGLGLSVNNGNGNGYGPPSQPPTTGTGSASDTSPLAIITLVLGILSWTLLPGFAAWAGVITGWIELDKIKKGKSPESNKTITQIGFWVSAINVILQILGGCAVAALFLIYGAAIFSAIGLSAMSQ